MLCPSPVEVCAHHCCLTETPLLHVSKSLLCTLWHKINGQNKTSIKKMLRLLILLTALLKTTSGTRLIDDRFSWIRSSNYLTSPLICVSWAALNRQNFRRSGKKCLLKTLNISGNLWAHLCIATVIHCDVYSGIKIFLGVAGILEIRNDKENETNSKLQ